MQALTVVAASVINRSQCSDHAVSLVAALFASLVIIGTGFGIWVPRTEAARLHANTTSFKFDFGPGKVAPGHIQILPDHVYNRELGYGFEPGAKLSCIDRGGVDPLRRDFCTSDKLFFFRSLCLRETMRSP